MAILNHMRANMPIILWALIFAFLALIVFDWGMGYYGNSMFGGQEELGTVNGEVIQRTDYSKTVENYTANFRQRNNSEPDDATTNAIEEQAWNDLVTVTLTKQKAQSLGLAVTTQEIYDWVTSENPPAFIRQFFTDQNGRFSREALIEAISNPQNAENWKSLDEPLRVQRLNDRYLNLVSAFAIPSHTEVKTRFTADNSRRDASYLFFNAAAVADSQVTVTDDDLEEFYTKNKDEFKKKETRKIRYVRFQMLPSAEDSAAIRTDADKLARDFAINQNDSAFVNRYSDKPYSSAWFSMGDISEAKSAAFKADTGSVLTILEPDGFHILKVQDKRTGEETKYRASHILIKATAPTVADTNAARDRAADLKKQLARDNRPVDVSFAEFARQHSTDGSAPSGGDLGWFGPGAMVKPFEDAVRSAKAGTVVGPVKTQFGFHLILVTGKSDTQVKLADVFVPIRPLSKTVRAIQAYAENFAYMATETGFDTEATAQSLEFAESPLVERRSVIPGIETSSSISAWMFRASVNDVSDVFTAGNELIVAQLTEISPEGFQPLDDQLKTSLRARVLREKKLDYVYDQATRVKAEIGTDLAAAASKNPALTVSSTGEFTMNGTPSGVGRDPIFSGVAFSLKEGETSNAFKGERGAYIIRITKATEADPTGLDSQQKRLTDQIRNQRRNEISNGWMESLKKSSEIEDNRAVALGQ